MLHVLTVFVIALAYSATGDYGCVCNYNVETRVYEQPSTTSKTVGYLYEFDCKEEMRRASVNNSWLALAFEHRIAFVKRQPQIEVQLCIGDPPKDDLVTTSTLTASLVTSISSTLSTLAASFGGNVQTNITDTPPKSTQHSISTTQSTTLVFGSSIAAETSDPTTASTLKSVVPSTLGLIHSSHPSSTSITKVTTTTSVSSLTGTAHICAQVLGHISGIGKRDLIEHGTTCYELVHTKLSWSTAQGNCVSKGGTLIHIDSQEEQDFINHYLQQHYNHPVWIGLHDKKHEEHFEWISGDPVTFTHWVPYRFDDIVHEFEDCVQLDPTNHGFWDDEECSAVLHHNNGYICQYDMDGSHATKIPTSHTSTSSPGHTTYASYTGGDGNINLCTALHQNHSKTYGTFLGQFGKSCYELDSARTMSWEHGESMCQNGHGHLAHISSAAEQAFVQSFLNRHLPNHVAWIGLHDRNNEGHFQWTSGDAVTYTNWVAGHTGNFVSPLDENCAVFIPYKGGKWDDVPCGSSGFGFGDIGEQHPPLCQFKTTTPILVG